MGTLKEIIKDLQAGEDVKEIDLRFSQIGDEEAKVLAQALQDNKTVTTIDLGWNRVGGELLEDIDKLLERNQLRAEELSKKNDQRIDSVQEKLLTTDIRLEEKQKIFKTMEQIKEIVQKQKLAQREAVHYVDAQKINEYNNVLKARGDKEIQQLVNSDHNLKLLLSNVSNSADLYEALESLLIGDIVSLSEGV